MRKVPFFGSSIPEGRRGGGGRADLTAPPSPSPPPPFFFSESIWCRDLPRLGAGSLGGRKCYCISYPTDLSRRNMKFLLYKGGRRGKLLCFWP